MVLTAPPVATQLSYANNHSAVSPSRCCQAPHGTIGVCSSVQMDFFGEAAASPTFDKLFETRRMLAHGFKEVVEEILMWKLRRREGLPSTHHIHEPA